MELDDLLGFVIPSGEVNPEDRERSTFAVAVHYPVKLEISVPPAESGRLVHRSLRGHPPRHPRALLRHARAPLTRPRAPWLRPGWCRNFPVAIAIPVKRVTGICATRAKRYTPSQGDTPC
jgi:hypothetical protein